MAKSLKDILTGVRSSKTEPVDLKDRAMSPEGNKGELDFAKKHKIEKHDDRVGNDDHIYQGTNTKTTKYKFQKDGVYESENLDERNEANALKHKTMDAARGAAGTAGKKLGEERYNWLDDDPDDEEHQHGGPPRGTMRKFKDKNSGQTMFQAKSNDGSIKIFRDEKEATKHMNSGDVKEATACNHSKKGVYCEVHGNSDCSGLEPKDMPKGGQKVLLDKKLKEDIINEVAPPNPKIEKWIKANKERFIKEYGKEKGTQVLYAKAWKMHGQSESGPATNTDYVGPGAAGWTTGRLDVGTL